MAKHRDFAYNESMLYLAYFCIALLTLLIAVLLFILASNVMSHTAGAPAISSPKHRLWLSFARKDKTFLDLGSGLGSVCLAAAPHFKHVYGIEFSPWYYLVSCWRTRSVSNITIFYGSMFEVEWPKVDYIYCYLLPGLMKRLRSRLIKSGATILCLSFPVPDQEPDRILTEAGRKLYVFEG